MMREQYGGYSEDSGGYEQRNAPVNVGDEIEVTIEAVGEKGDGLAKKDGFVLFVPNAKKGEKVKVRITRVLKKVGFAEVVGQTASGSTEEKSPRTEEPMDGSEGSSGQPGGSSGSYEDTEDFGEDNNS